MLVTFKENEHLARKICNNIIMTKVNLFGMTLAELEGLCASEGMPRFAAKQMADWLYAKHVDSIDEMTNLSLKARARLNETACIGRQAPINCQVSRDGTKKYLFEIENSKLKIENNADAGNNSQFSILNSQLTKYVEAVYIPDGDRATLCISCQVGCRMGCRFCVTGQQGFHGSLSAADILNQIFSIPEFDRLTNIVYMGMGEPMDNLDAVLRSTEVLTAPWGLGWSPKRITVSTVGIIPGLERFLNESQCHVAVSLHNPFAAERQEYIMFRGLNDDTRHAAELVRLLKGLYCRVNLIRFHASPQTPYKTSSPQTINAFRDYLNAHGVTCTLRASRGEDIMAACGLLAGQKKNG